MATVKITDISGLTVPYDIFVCDKDGNDCVFVSTITIYGGGPIDITVPFPYEKSSEVGVKLLSAECQAFESRAPTQTYEIYDCCSGVTRYVDLGSGFQYGDLIQVVLCESNCLDPILQETYTFCGLIQGEWAGLADTFTIVMTI